MRKIDIDTKFETYGDRTREKGEKTGMMSPDVKLVAEKVNEIVEYINDREQK